MKKIFKILFLLSILFSGGILAYQLSAEEDKILSGYELYLDRNDTICTAQYEPDNKIYNSESDYIDYGRIKSSRNTTSIEGNDLDIAKKMYKDTQNSVYKCALLNAQERSINFIMDTLGENKKVGILSKQYKEKLSRLPDQRTLNKCLDTNKTNKQQDKANILKQTTYELCKYNNYLEYLLEYNSVIANILEQDKKTSKNNKQKTDDDKDSILTETYNITKIANLEKQKKFDILTEIDKAYKLHPIAFQAYSEYENNLPIHDMLTLLRSDFIKYRDSLNKNLSPINQLVYKISNAMKE